ncbi:WD40 repeat-like protein [Mycena amicta]|nr:WD40 repeat-like protein [Mycena amicta]
MSHFPYTHLSLASSIAVAISGPHIQIIDARTGNLIATTAGRAVSTTAGPIRVAALDRDGRHLITAGDDKQLKLWQIDGLQLVNTRELPKRPTALGFTKDGQTILAADKFGDVFSYPLEHVPPTFTSDEKNTALTSHENPSGGRLILGHVSLLNAFVLSPDEKYIVTADRDEHIRVSWYPQGYTIESYCLGHTKFVSAIHIPHFAPDILISGGGDTMLKVWNWLDGRLLRDISVLHVVEPYIIVEPARKTPRRFGGDWEGREAEQSGSSKAKGKRKEKGKGSQQRQDSEVAEEQHDLEVADQKVLAISQIESLSGTHILFSAFGATALFYFALPDSDSTPTDVYALDFGKPVLGFNTVYEDGLVWVSLDGGWSDADARSMVRLAKLDADGKLVEVADSSSPLLTTLTSTALVAATPAELTALELYAPLTALPKGRESEHDPMERAAGESVAGDERELSKKELGRLKTKKAVAKKQGREGEDEDERETKRVRSDQEEDVQMGDVS